MKSVLYILIYCMLLIGCRAPIELKEDLSFFPQTLASSSACNKDNCLAFATERYEVNETTYTPVDMVFVLDVSRSMEDNLEKISLASSSLISYIEPLDWRIAFTTADHGDSQYYCASGKIKTRISSTGQSQKFCPKEHRIFPQPADSWTNYTGIDPKFGTFMYLQNDKHILNQSILSNQIQNYKDVF